MNQGQGPWKANTCHHSDWLTCHGFRMLEAAPSALIRGAKNFRHATERHHARLLDRVGMKGLSNIADHEGQYLRRVKSSPSLSAVKQLIVSPGSICRSSLARCAREAWPKCKASNFPRQVAQFLDKVWKAPARKKLMHAATPKPMTTWHDAENSSEQHHHSPPFPVLHLTSKSFFGEVVASTWNYSKRDEKLVFWTQICQAKLKLVKVAPPSPGTPREVLATRAPKAIDASVERRRCQPIAKDESMEWFL